MVLYVRKKQPFMEIEAEKKIASATRFLQQFENVYIDGEHKQRYQLYRKTGIRSRGFSFFQDLTAAAYN